MAGAVQMLKLNPALATAALTEEFRSQQRVQIVDLLEEQSALELQRLLIEQTPWGVTWQAGDDGPHRLRHDQMGGLTPSQMSEMADKLNAAISGEDFAFVYSQYRISAAVTEGWSQSPAHDVLLAELNSEPFLDFIRDVTELPQIGFCDAQASHYGPNQFLSVHQDINVEEDEDRLVAYVLNLTSGRWRPDWGGYLLFFDERGDIAHGYMPRFNCLNMFRVPRHHSVSYVPPFAAGNRLAITGWFRGR